jgi:hypothetical protein
MKRKIRIYLIDLFFYYLKKWCNTSEKSIIKINSKYLFLYLSPEIESHELKVINVKKGKTRYKLAIVSNKYGEIKYNLGRHSA